MNNTALADISVETEAGYYKCFGTEMVVNFVLSNSLIK